eukprot:jgi/Undpi1/5619/HiC_scaffold_2.g00894.m1
MAADGLGIDYTVHWDGILNRSNNVASASFTPSRAARKHLFPAGIHERDMLLSVTGPASEAMRAVFLRTRDDLLVLGCLRGFRSHARACVYLGLLAPFDAALVFFFRRGLEYTSAAAAGAAGPPFPEVLKNPGLPDVTDMAACAPFASGCVVHRDLLALKCGLELARAYPHCVSTAWGPLLECLFALADLQALPARLTDVDDFGDAQGNPLPPSVFAKRCRDRARSGQTVLLSNSGRRRGVAVATAAAAAAASAGGGGGRGGLWGSLSGVLFSRAGEGGGGGGGGGSGGTGGAAADAAIGALSEVLGTVQLEQLFPQTKDLPLEVVEGLLSALLTIRDPAAPRRSTASTAAGTQPRDASGSGSNGSSGAPGDLGRSNGGLEGSGSGGWRGMGRGGVGGGSEAESMAAAAAAAASFEAHSVLALELSSRVVLANRHRVSRLWPALHCFLARVLGGEGSVTMTRMPFLVERAMVTVLRACIHMFDREDMAELLLQSLKLLLSLPANVVVPLSNRLASGLLILIQANASALSLASAGRQWEVIAALMQKAAFGDGGRGFVLEALAFVVNRGLGLLGRHNVFAVHAALTRFAKGDFLDGKADFAWALQACTTLETMTFTLLRDLNDPPHPPLHLSLPREEDGKDASSHEPPPSSEKTDTVGAGPTLSRDEAEGLWLSTLYTLSMLAGSVFPKVAKGAADALERLVLELHGIRPLAWGTAFAEVLLKLPVPLFPPNFRPAEGVAVHGTWSEEVCLRCCSILSRTFLHHLQALSTLQGFDNLWLDTISLLSQNFEGTRVPGRGGDSRGSEGREGGVTGGGVGGVAAESCQQILTNMLMVAAYAGVLGRQEGDDMGPGDASGGGGARSGGGGGGERGDPRRLLYQTRQIIEPVCPGLRPLLAGLAGAADLPTEVMTPPPSSSQLPPPPQPYVPHDEGGVMGGGGVGAGAGAGPGVEINSPPNLGGASRQTMPIAGVREGVSTQEPTSSADAPARADSGGGMTLGESFPSSNSSEPSAADMADPSLREGGGGGGAAGGEGASIERDGNAHEIFDRPAVSSAPPGPVPVPVSGPPLQPGQLQIV